VSAIHPDEHEFKDARVTVMGLGSFGGGVGAAKFLAERGARVTVTDLKESNDLAPSIEALQGYDIRYVLGHHDEADFTGADMVVASPAVPRESPLLKAAREAGVRLRTELGLFVERCPAPVCGVTGSNGKTTTVSLIGAALAESGMTYYLGGNIGKSLLDDLPRIIRADRVVLEISSFQIEWLDELGWSPRIAALLNIMPNHLDRHGTLVAYSDIKARLFDHQSGGDTAIIVTDDPGARRVLDRVRGKLVRVGFDPAANDVTLEECWIVRHFRKRTERVFDTSLLRLPGVHNIMNALAAAACALEMGVSSEDIAKGFAGFGGAPHRLEMVDTIGGVRYVNDSKATTPDAATAGITSFAEGVIPILGGYDKGMEFDAMARAIAGKVRWAALIGVTAPKIRDALAEHGVDSNIFDSLDEAFRAASDRAIPGDVVLLSPGCASYDMFSNYEERGLAFRALVLALEKPTRG
jgi:UDP-N-acetylmuramoylalanine--D-glutamate ligase